jgi:photosystem II stability/assembly factor-like uncharacterized protein
MMRRMMSCALLCVFLSGCNLPVPATPVPDSVSTEASVPTPTPVSSTPTARTLLPAAGPHLTQLAMLDAQAGWALDETRLLSTADGGRTWLDATPPGLALSGSASFAALDAQIAWLLIPAADFEHGTLYRTANGGVTWESFATPFGMAALDFLDPHTGRALAYHGVAAGSAPVSVFQTADGGATWMKVFTDVPGDADTREDIPLGGNKSGFGFLDADVGWVGGSIPMDNVVYLYATADGGRTWAAQEPGTPAGWGGMFTVESPVLFPPDEGVLPVRISGEPAALVFYLLTDDGQYWAPTLPVTLAGAYAIASPFDFWVWDGGPALFVTHDGGATWATLEPNATLPYPRQLQFVDATTGWLLADDGTLYQTVDGGLTWGTLLSP